LGDPGVFENWSAITQVTPLLFDQHQVTPPQRSTFRLVLILVIVLTRYPQSSWATLFFSIYLAQRIVRNYLSVPTWIVRNWPPVPLVWLSFRGRITCCWYIVLVMKEGLEFRDCRVWWKVPMFLGLQAGKSSQWRIYRVFLFSIYFNIG